MGSKLVNCVKALPDGGFGFEEYYTKELILLYSVEVVDYTAIEVKVFGFRNRLLILVEIVLAEALIGFKYVYTLLIGIIAL